MRTYHPQGGNKDSQAWQFVCGMIMSEKREEGITGTAARHSCFLLCESTHSNTLRQMGGTIKSIWPRRLLESDANVCFSPLYDASLGPSDTHLPPNPGSCSACAAPLGSSCVGEVSPDLCSHHRRPRRPAPVTLQLCENPPSETSPALKSWAEKNSFKG